MPQLVATFQAQCLAPTAFCSLASRSCGEAYVHAASVNSGHASAIILCSLAVQHHSVFQPLTCGGKIPPWLYPPTARPAEASRRWAGEHDAVSHFDDFA